MPNSIYRVFFTTFFFLLLLITGYCHPYTSLDTVRGPSYNQLKNDIEQVTKNYPGLCAGLAIVHKDHSDWIVAIDGGKPGSKTISENTIFRTASISKIFVALAVLKLQEEGKLSLEDEIKNIVPEVKFENLWEDTKPVQLVHLLEHTTGWDEIHLIERVHNLTPPVTLKNALEFHPHSRKSRWVPGSRMSYCNSGYAVAAYIVEKISRVPFEQYVGENILRPLKMDHSTFFNDKTYQQLAAETYNWAMENVEYKNELYRPAAALNSSAKDMAQLLKLLLNRGKIDSQFLFAEGSIDRMESPKSTPGAKEGLELGYGLGNFTSVHKGLTYQGHDGAMDGGLSQLAYLPEHGIGHVILLNANNAQAMHQIISLIRDFEMKMLSISQEKVPVYEGPIDIREGYYLSINPRSQNLFYQDIFLNIDKVEIHKNHITKSWIIPGNITSYYPVSPIQFTLETTGKISLVEAEDPIAGKVLYTETSVLKPISNFRVFGQMFLLGLWIALIIMGVLGFSIFTLLFLTDREKYKAYIRICMLPTLSSLFIMLTFFPQFFGIENADLYLSEPTLISISLLVFSLLFVLGALASVIIIYRSRNLNINRLTFYFLAVLSGLHTLASIFLMYFGFIPLFTWE